MILKYYYPELPSQVRIKSEALCLDHFFDPAASEKSISIQELCALSHAGFIDGVDIFVPKEAEAYYVDEITGDKIPILGWTNIGMFDGAVPFT